MARVAPLLSKRAASGLIAAIGVGAVGDAMAQSRFMYSLSVPAEVEYDSNPDLAAGPTSSTTWFRVTPALTGRYVLGDDEFLLDGALAAEKSSNASVKDRLDPRLRAAWKHAAPRDTIELAAEVDRRSLRSVELRELVPVGVDGSRTLFALSGNWRHELDERTAFSADVRHEWERFSGVTDTPDFRRTTAAVRLTRQMDENRSWYTALNGQLYRPEALAGVQAADSRVVGAVAGLDWAVSPAWRVDVNAGPVHFDQGSSRRLAWQGALKAEYTADRWFASLEASRSPGVNATFAGLVNTDELRMRLRWDFDALARIEADAGYAREKATDTSRSRMSLAWIRQWKPAWQFLVRVSTHRLEGAGGSARSNRISFGLVYTAPDL